LNLYQPSAFTHAYRMPSFIACRRGLPSFPTRRSSDLFKAGDAPVMSHTLFRKGIQPELQEGKTLLVVIDNLRYDQWLAFEKNLGSHYKKKKESAYYSILPTATQYARNAIFSGLMPLEMEKQHSDWWKDDTAQGGKNLFESEFVGAQMKRLGLVLSWEYHSFSNLKQG